GLAVVLAPRVPGELRAVEGAELADAALVVAVAGQALGRGPAGGPDLLALVDDADADAGLTALGGAHVAVGPPEVGSGHDGRGPGLRWLVGLGRGRGLGRVRGLRTLVLALAVRRRGARVVALGLAGGGVGRLAGLVGAGVRVDDLTVARAGDLLVITAE